MAGLKEIFSSMKREGYIIKDLDMFLLKKGNKEGNDRAINVNSPSSVGTCPRASYYRRIGVERDSNSVNARTRRIFENGDGVHERLQGYLKEMGILLMDEVPIINTKYLIQGHTDGLLQLSASELGVLEIKSINDRGFTQLKDAKEEHKMQALVYLYGLEERRKSLRKLKTFPSKEKLFKEYQKFYTHMKDGSKFSAEEKLNFQCELSYNRDFILFSTRVALEKCIILYENKNNQELKEFIISMDDENTDKLNIHLSIFEYINQCVEEKIEPERICSSKSDSLGRWCNYKNSCFIV